MAANKKKENKTRVKSSSLKLEGIKELGGTEEDVTLLQDVADSGSGSEAESVADDVSDDDSIQQDEIQNFLKQLDIEKHRPKVKGSKKAEHTEAANEDQEPSTSSNKVDKKEKNKYKVQHSEVSSSVKDPGVEYRAHVRAYQSRKYLLVKPGEYFDTTQASEGDGNLPGLPSDLTRQMEEFAAKLLSDEIDVYNKQRENAKRSDVQWMRTVLTSGTLADKVAALTVLLQESPLHNVTYIDTLLNMARKKNRRENLQAVDTLKELFLTDIMPSNRKLKAFAQHDLTSLGSAAGWNRDVMDKRLLLWQYEAQLKLKYTEFVNILKTLAHDVLLPTKQKAVSTIFNMLVEKPEQEKLLLTTLINKVGDPHYKLAATVSHLLTKLVETHPNMKTIVVREVEQLIFRPNVAERAQYYSVCFLNQLRLSPSHRQLAAKLISIYFAFFKGFVKKGEVDSKMMSALLSGVNRAYPYAKLEEKVLSEQLEHLYKIVHIVNFNTSLQALMLLYQVMGTSESISERYYNALYRKLVDPALATSSKQAAFLNLVFKSIKMDESERRVKAFAKRLLQVCRYQQPPFTCGALVLLSEVLKVKPGVLTLTHTEEDSDDEEHFVDQPAPDDPDHTIKPDSDSDQASSDVEQTEAKHKPSTWVHKKNLNHKTERMDYDPYHRNPAYCHAENACMWELQGLAAHFHPTVALFARQILQGESIEYPGDPLQDFTLIRFLERFVFKNPKKKQQVEEKLGALSRVKSEVRGIKTLSVTSDTFANLEERIVPVDDVFLHRYFRQKLSRKTPARKRMMTAMETVSVILSLTPSWINMRATWTVLMLILTSTSPVSLARRRVIVLKIVMMKRKRQKMMISLMRRLTLMMMNLQKSFKT
ncbi:CCAAT/enhancer-binding protein zeta-like [Dreissena polymorpha]|uniref:CCAAT/enhancer-binding protein zeta-like n=1 Tax=Dreissena polymorpha TaxID=45954 RepID=UPI0022644322|nr:CCAAT/enhancer-binding protein zeta-like [Dreissena polymorpha]